MSNNDFFGNGGGFGPEETPVYQPTPMNGGGGDRYGKPYSKKKSGRGDVVTHLGDFAEGVKRLLLSPNLIYFFTVALAGFFFVWNAAPFTELARQYVGPVRADVGWLRAVPLVGEILRMLASWLLSSAAAIVAIMALAVIQFMEILPRLHRYIPGFAERRLFKLNSTKTQKPSGEEGTPTLTGKLYGWIVTRSERNQQIAFWVGAAFYVLDIYVCSQKLPVGDFVVGFSLMNLCLLGLQVFGFELALLFASVLSEYRLNARQQAAFYAKHPHLDPSNR